MNHYFTVNNSTGCKVFLPIDSVLKDENNPPPAATASDHPYYLRSKDKHNVRNVNPEATIHLIEQYSQKEGQSKTQFMAEQREYHENYELRKQQEEAAKRQHRSPGEDVDIHKIDVDEQNRIYKEAQRASKQGGEGQKNQSDTDFYKGGINNSQQHGGRHNQPPAIVHGSSVDSAGYGHNVVLQQRHTPQDLQHQSQRPNYHQNQGGYNLDHNFIPGQQQFHGSQVSEYQNQQHQNYRQDVHYPGHAVAQHPYPRSDPAAQMADIPRAGVGDNHPYYNPANDMPYGHSSSKGPGPHRQVSHQYEPVPGPPDQPDPYNQQHQQNPGSDQINPYNLEKGSMILYGDPPRSGMIKWIGYPLEVHVLTAGVEMVSTHFRQK